MLVAVVVAAGLAWYFLGDHLSRDKLAAREAEFREFQQSHPVLVYVVAFAIYVAVTGLSLPGATGMTLLLGWLFGFWRALILVSFASTAGATIAFLVSRYLFRNAMQQRFGERLATFNQSLEREGAFYLFTLRLIPAVPFFVINVVMGLTPIPILTYWWVSQIGMLPGTAVFTYAGSNLPDLDTLATLDPSKILSLELIVSFILLGLFPLIVRRVYLRFRPQSVDRIKQEPAP